MGIGRILTPGVPRTIAAAFGLAFGLTLVGAQAQTFTGPGITVSGTDGQSEGSSIQVSGISGTLTSMSLKFNSLNVTNLNGIGVVLVAPSGQALDVMSGMCGGPQNQQVGSSTFTLADTGATGTGNDSGYMAGWPQGSSNPDGTCPAAYSGTYLPTDYYSTLAVFNSPGPSSYSAAGNPAGAASTFASVFGSSTLNGTWTLYIANQTNASGSLGSWSLNLVTNGTGASTTTSLASNAANNETTLSSSVTFTATVTSSGTVSSGTVSFTDGGSNLTCAGGNPAAVSSGTATCSASFSTEGAHSIVATYNAGSGFNGSNTLLNFFVNHATTNPSAGQYCNTGGMSISSSLTASNNPASPYPSHIDVSGYSGTITGATLTLNGFSDADPQTTTMLLVGPTGTDIVPWDNVGGTTAVSSISFTLADSAGSSNTISSPPANGDTYYPTAAIGVAPAFPLGSSPWGPPSTLSLAPNAGGQTFTNAFNGINPNGEWSLYLYNAAGSTSLSATSWCVNLLQQTSMTVGSSHTGSFTQGDTADTYTITVKNGGTVATSGTLNLNDALPSGMSVVSFHQTGNTGGGTGSDWSCSGVSCTRTTPMPAGEQDTLTLTLSVGYTTTTGTNADTNSVTVSGGNLLSSYSANDPTTVNAGQVQVTFNTNPTGLSYSVGGTPYSSQQTLSETNGSTVSLATTSPQTLSSTQYLFSNWSDSGTLSHNATISSTNGTATYTANFNAAYTLTTAANPTAGGSVSPSSGTYGGTVNLTAIPNTNWAFTSWTGPVASTSSASTTITMSANESATANFAPNGQTTVWIVNSIGGLSELTGTGVPATTTAYTGGNTAIALDAIGNLWTLNSSSPLLYKTNQLGSVKSSISSGGGLNAPVSLAIDGAGQVWVVNGNNTVSLFSNAGGVLSPTGGFTDSSLDVPSGVAVDQSGSVWVANKTGNSLTRILGAAAPAAPLSTAAANNTTGARP